MAPPSGSHFLTQTSEHAQVIADTFRAAFAASKVGDCVVEMTAPKDSTRGGALALQHITLKAPTGLTLVVGSVNAPAKAAQIRSFAAVSTLHEERFHKPVTFDAASYEAMVETARSLLSAFGVELSVTDDGARTEPFAARATATGSKAAPLAKTASRRRDVLLFIAVASVVAVEAGILTRYLLQR